MKTKSKKIHFIAFVIAIMLGMVAFSIFMIPTDKAIAEDAAPTWTANSAEWTVTGEGKDAEYTKTEGAFGGAPAIAYPAAVNFNTLELNAILNKTQGESNITLNITLENNYLYGVELRNYNNVCHTRIRRYYGNYTNETVVAGEKTCAAAFSENAEYALKFVFQKNYLEIFVNGVSENRCVFTEGEFDIRSLTVSSWNTTATIKNIRMNSDLVAASGWLSDGGWNMTSDDTVADFDKIAAEGSSSIGYYGDIDFNTVELTVTVDELHNNDKESNLGLNIFLTDGRLYFLEVNYGQNSVRYREMSHGNNWLDYGLAGYTYTAGKEHTVKFVFCENFFDTVVDGGNRQHSFGSGLADFNIARITISAFHTKTNIKNIKTSTSPVELPFGWIAGDWTENASEYTAPISDGVVNMTHTGKFAGNTIEFAARPNDYRWLEGGFGVIFTCNGGTTDYYFESFVNSAGGHLRLRRSGTLLGGVDMDLDAKAFANFKVVFDEDYILFYVNGNRVLALFDTQGDKFDNHVMFNGWGVAPTVKNIVVSDSEIDYAAAGYVDLEFKDDRAKGSLTAASGDVNIIDGKYVWTIDGDNTLTSTTIDVTRGSDYSALLSVRNTLLVHMKNETAASKLKLSFITSEDGAYNDAKSKTFDILPNSDFTTYYFNLSDLAGCKGYLRGFKLTFVGATSGTVSIDAITFEREDPIYDYAGSIISCLADKESELVTVTGRLAVEHAGKNVTVATTPVNNYTSDPTYNGPAYGNPTHLEVVKVWTGKAAADGSFTAEFPLQNGVVTHLSSKFLAFLDDKTLVAPEFKITNYYDFTENPYAFTLNDLTVDVTDERFGAKGNGFTDDNDAIQAAIDYVSSQGGGTVVLPGDTSTPYGRRYVATRLDLKSNIEFRIEPGAVLWQSRRAGDYNYKVTYGHDVDIDGLVWCHVGVTVNYPLLYINGKSNVRVTGGGTIRMMESGTEQPDGYHYAWSTDGTPNITLDCGNTIHIAPFFAYDSDHVELSGITILRSNIWHTTWPYSRNLYIADNDFREAECINGDGFGIGTAKNVVLERNYLYSNDDAITLSCYYRDGRGQFFYPSKPGTDHCTENVVIRHNNLFGGLGLTFIPWGSEDPDLSKEEAKNIEVYDNIIGGTSRAIGSWPDNPFYGWSKYYDYNLDNGETDDYSPTKDIFIYDNIFRNTVAVGVMQITNAVTDCGLYSPNDFVNASFERELRYPNETEFVSGLSYWSSNVEKDKGEVGTSKLGTKVSQIKYPENGGATSATVGDYAGYVKGNGELFQGLNGVMGAYDFTARVWLSGGTAKLFARDGKTGDILAEKQLNISGSFETITLSYTVPDATTVQLGIIHEGELTDIVYIDDAAVAPSANSEIYEVKGETKTWNFDTQTGYTVYGPSGSGVSVNNGYLTTLGNDEYKIVFDGTDKATTFDARADIVLSGSPVNIGIYFAVGDVQNTRDRITAYNVHVDYKAGHDYYNVYLYKFSEKTGYLGDLSKSANIPLPETGKLTLRVVVINGTVYAFTSSDVFDLAFKLPSDYNGGSVGIRSQFCAARIDNFSVTSPDFATPPSPVDRTALDAAIASAADYNESEYTAESYAVLKAALLDAGALPETATQAQIDAAKSKINAAIAQLEKQTKPDEPGPGPTEPDVKKPSSDVGLSAGAIAGIVIGCVAAVALIAGLALFLIKKRKK